MYVHFCGGLEWREEGEGREERDVCIHIVDSLYCSAEANTTL